MQQLKQIQQVAKYGNDLTEFTFTSANQKVTSYLIDGKIHFVAADICKVLGYANTTDVLKRLLDEDEYLTYGFHRAGQKRNSNLITESGLYHLIFQSKKSNAKEFRRKVTNEILPEIRKTGSYTALPKEAGIFKGLKASQVNGRKMYPFKQFMLTVGFSAKSSGYSYRIGYPGHFVTMGKICVVSEELALQIFHSRRLAATRRTNKQMQPVLPFNFGEPLQITFGKKGGSHA